ncbi:MAG: hypothetical protein QM691_02075 [Opitutaceae bacterium]
MNSSSTQPRSLACRLVRWRAALTDAAPPSTGHAAACPACRAYFQAVGALDNRLRREALPRVATPSDGLEQRLSAAVRRAASPAAPRSRRVVPLWSLGLASVAAAFALLFVFRPHDPADETIGNRPAADAEAVVTVARSWGRNLRDTLAPQVARLSEPDPLGRELGRVSTDARSALSFLAANFLPTSRGLEPGEISPSPSS